MTKDNFTQKLKDIQLSKKDFAFNANISYNTVNNWNNDKKPVPPWVKSWLENFTKAKTYENIKREVFNIEGI